MPAYDHTIQVKADNLIAKYPASMIAILDHSGKYLFASESHRELLGYEPDELLHLNLRQIILPADMSHVDLAFGDAVLRGKSIEIGTRLVTKSGHVVRARASAENVEDPISHQMFIIGKSEIVT